MKSPSIDYNYKTITKANYNVKMDFIPGYVHFCVVQERDDDHVGGENEDGHHIVNEYINPTCHLRPQVQQVQHRSH